MEYETQLDALSLQAQSADSGPTKMVGFWRTQEFIRVNEQTAGWLDLLWIVGPQRAWHVVTVYADEAMTVPLLRWDIVRKYELGESVQTPAGAVELDWLDQNSWLTAYVEDEGLWQNLGLEDCSFELGKPKSTRTDNCGAPLFPFRDCTLMDFADLKDNTLTFGDPLAVDRCQTRVTEFEDWTFERTTFRDVAPALRP